MGHATADFVCHGDFAACAQANRRIEAIHLSLELHVRWMHRHCEMAIVAQTKALFKAPPVRFNAECCPTSLHLLPPDHPVRIDPDPALGSEADEALLGGARRDDAQHVEAHRL